MSEPTPTPEDLLAAVNSQDLASVERCLMAGVRPSEPWAGTTAVHAAVGAGRIDILETLVTAADYLEVQDVHGRTPLHLAAQRGLPEECRLLLVSGHPPDPRDRHGRTPLHRAARPPVADEDARFRRHGKTELLQELGRRAAALRVLVEHGADLNAADDSGSTPAHLAAEAGWAFGLETLLDLGADLDARDDRGRTPFVVALEKCNLSCVSLLVSKIRNEQVDQALVDGLFGQVIESGNRGSAEVLLNRGWFPSAPVVLRAAREKEGIFTAMTRHGVDRCLAHWLAERGEADLVLQVLCQELEWHRAKRDKDEFWTLEHRCDEAAFCVRPGPWLLTWAVGMGRADIVRMILELARCSEWIPEWELITTPRPCEREVGKQPEKLHVAPPRGSSCETDSRIKALQDGLVEAERGLVLRVVAHGGNRSATELLVRAGVSSEDLDAALCMAVEQGRAGVVELLLEAGARPDARNEEDQPVIVLAAENDRKEVVEVLLRRGVPVDDAGEDGWTALHVAAERCNATLVELLLKKGANPDARNQGGETPLDVLLSRHHGLVGDDVDGGRERSLAAAVQLLLERTSRPGMGSRRNELVLHVLAEHDLADLVDQALEKGADPAAVNRDGESAFWVAVRRGNGNVGARLLDAAGGTDGEMDALLLLGVFRHEVGVVRRAIEKRGVERVVVLDELKTWVEKGGVHCEWVAAGNGRRPLWWAALSGSAEVVRVVMAAGARPDWETRVAAAVSGNGDVLAATCGSAADAETEIDGTLLHAAAAAGQIASVEWLLKKGWLPVDCLDRRGRSPLHWAVERGFRDTAKFLLENGADPNLRDGRGDTPLFLAVKRGSLTMLMDLVARGGDLLAEDRSGRTAYDVAVESNNLGIARFILDRTDGKGMGREGIMPLLRGMLRIRLEGENEIGLGEVKDVDRSRVGGEGTRGPGGGVVEGCRAVSGGPDEDRLEAALKRECHAAETGSLEDLVAAMERTERIADGDPDAEADDDLREWRGWLASYRVYGSGCGGPGDSWWWLKLVNNAVERWRQGRNLLEWGR